MAIPEFLVVAFVAALVAALAGGLLSTFVVLRRASFSAEAFAHIAFAGMAVALLAGLPYGVVTFAFVAAVAFVVGSASSRLAVAEVNLTTIFLAVSMAAGVLLLSAKKGYVPDVADYLFGNILLVTGEDLAALVVLAAVDLVWLVVFFRAMYYTSYNEEAAAVNRIPVRLVTTVFLVLLACNVVVAVKIAGVIMVTAGMVLPGTIALLMTRRIVAAHFLAVGVSLLATVTGFALSLAGDLPTGPLVVVIQFGFLILTLAVRGMLRR